MVALTIEQCDFLLHSLGLIFTSANVTASIIMDQIEPAMTQVLEG